MEANTAQMMDTPPFQHQRRVLTKRYRASMVGDLGTVSLLLLQAPFIGWLCTLVWDSVETDTASLYFVLSLSAVWFGCINACREIVKDRAILERERLLGLNLTAYLCAQFVVLATISFGQVLLLQVAVEWSLALRGVFFIQTFALWLGSLAGISLGLLVSAIAQSQERAVGAIPLLILPQILFSEFAIPREHFTGLVQQIERIMPVRWCYEIFTQLADVETDWLMVLLSFVLLVMLTVVFGGFARIALLSQRDVL